MGEALDSGGFDGVLGDREAAVGTYREFVVFDEAQASSESACTRERVLQKLRKPVARCDEAPPREQRGRIWFPYSRKVRK